MIFRKLFIAILLLSTIAIAGCASLNNSMPFQYQPSLVALNKKIEKNVGLSMLVDKRPQGDAAYTKSIKDVPDKITSKLLEDFDKSKIFTSIEYPPDQGDDILLEGTINRFMWKLYATPITYIPIINLVAYFGVPCYSAYGIADITLIAKDPTTGNILGTFTGCSKINTEYTLYNFKAGEAGGELADALRDAAKQLKEEMIGKLGS